MADVHYITEFVCKEGFPTSLVAAEMEAILSMGVVGSEQPQCHAGS